MELPPVIKCAFNMSCSAYRIMNHYSQHVEGKAGKHVRNMANWKEFECIR